MELKRCFEILQLPPEASLKEVREAYRDLVKVWHPDRFTDSFRLKDKAQRQLQEINTAYHQALIHLENRSDRTFKLSGGARSATTRPSPARTPSHTKAQPASKKPATASFSATPSTREILWRRCLARLSDYLLWFLFLAISGLYEHFLPYDTYLLAYIMSGTLVWTCIEANLLNLTGTTPGKWLWRLHLFMQPGKKPPLLSSLRRSFKVWYQGLALGFAPLTPVAIAYTYTRFQETGRVRWDREERFSIVATPLFGKHLYLAAGLLALALMINGLLFKQIIETDRTAAPPPPAQEHNGATAAGKPSVSDDHADTYPEKPYATLEQLPVDVQPRLRDLYRRIHQDANNPDLYLERGRLLLSRQMYQEALADFNRAIFLAPGMLKAWLGRAELLRQLLHAPEFVIEAWCPLAGTNYGQTIKEQFFRCRQQTTCRIRHDTQQIRQTLLNDYQVCRDRCDDFNHLPDGLRYVGIGGTARLLHAIFEATDAAFANLYAFPVEAPRRQEAAAANNFVLIANLVHDLRSKNYGAEETRIFEYIHDYNLLSQILYMQRQSDLQTFVQEQKRLQQTLALEQMRAQQALAERRERLQDGRQVIETLEDAKWVYQAEDGTSFVINPPLPPLAAELAERYFLISGTLEGLYISDDATHDVNHDNGAGTVYRMSVANARGVYPARFRLRDNFTGGQLQSGKTIYLIGRLIDIAPHSNGSSDPRFAPGFAPGFIPVFEAVYFDLK